MQIKHWVNSAKKFNKMEDETIIKSVTSYQAAWSWMILSIMFLISSMVMFALPRSLITSSFYVGFFLIFIICIFMAMKRRAEFNNLADLNEAEDSGEEEDE